MGKDILMFGDIEIEKIDFAIMKVLFMMDKLNGCIFD